MQFITANHIALVCNDVEQARAFYEAIGGVVAAVIQRKTGDGVNYFMKLGEGLLLEIQAPRAAEYATEKNVWEHLALSVSDCAAMCDAMEALGAVVEKRPTNNKLGSQPIINAVVYGPGGEKIELIQTV